NTTNASCKTPFHICKLFKFDLFISFIYPGRLWAAFLLFRVRERGIEGVSVKELFILATPPVTHPLIPSLTFREGKNHIPTLFSDIFMNIIRVISILLK
ncbi:MAG: hypothetical protein JXB48_02015, partial [Candidatus Latescibacteria bacterium]|nr:hypothetical protein [Candidatus Latescibacterota bacterium]